ncbi:MAG: hypothetical protein HGA94_01040 [Candidatus Aminicenantes bacterium]|nr:hypothetical protein [Candidatus Aminicenantes bacterium]
MAGLTALALANLFPGQTKTPAEKYKALLGTWDTRRKGTDFTTVFVFTLEKGVLKGIYDPSMMAAKMTDLTFENNTVQFTVTSALWTLGVTAVIDGDNLSGQESWDWGEEIHNITGKKRTT